MEKVEDKKTCFFCRLKLSPTNVFKVGSMGEETKTVLWEEKCAETLCEIFFGDSDHQIKIYFQNAAYCIRCQQLIWNIDFSWRQLLYLRERVDDLSLKLRKLLMANCKTIKAKAAIKKPYFEAENFYGTYLYDQVIQILRTLLINGDALSGVNVPMGRTPECQKGDSRRQERNKIEKVTSSKVNNQGTMQCKECLKRQNEQEKNVGSSAKRPRTSASFNKDVCTQTEKKKKTKSKKKKKDKELERKIAKILNRKTEKYKSPVKIQSPRKSTKSTNSPKIVNNNKTQSPRKSTKSTNSPKIVNNKKTQSRRKSTKSTNSPKIVNNNKTQSPRKSTNSPKIVNNNKTQSPRKSTKSTNSPKIGNNKKTQSPRKSTKSTNSPKIVNNNKPKRKTNILKLPLQEANNRRKENIDIAVSPLVEVESCESTTYSEQSLSAPVQTNTSTDSKNSKTRVKGCRLRSDRNRRTKPIAEEVGKKVGKRVEADLPVPCDSADTSTQLDIERFNEHVVPSIKIDEIKHVEIEVLSESDLLMVDLQANTLHNSVTVSEDVQAVRSEDITAATSIREDKDVHDTNVNTNADELPIVEKFSDTDTFQTVAIDEIPEVKQIAIESDTLVDTKVNIDKQCGQVSPIQSITNDEMPDVIEMNVESDNILPSKLNIKQSSQTSAPPTTKTLLMPHDSSSDDEVLSVEKSTNKSPNTEVLQVVTNAERTEGKELHSGHDSSGMCDANVNINTNEVKENVELFSEDEHLKANDDFVESIDVKMVSEVVQREVHDEMVEVTDAEIVFEQHETMPELTQNAVHNINTNDSSFEIVQDDNGDNESSTITSINDIELTSKILEKPQNEETHEISDTGAMCDQYEETSEILEDEDEDNIDYTSDNNSDYLFESEGGGDESNISDGEWDQVLADSLSVTDDDDKSMGIQSSSEDDESPPLATSFKPTVAVNSNKKEVAFLKNTKILTMPDDSSSGSSDSDDNFKKKAGKSTPTPSTPTKQISRAPVTPTSKQLVMPSDSSSTEDEDCLPKSKVVSVKKGTKIGGAPVTPTTKQLVMPSDSSSTEDEDEDCLPKRRVISCKKGIFPGHKKTANRPRLSSCKRLSSSTIKNYLLLKPVPTTSNPSKSNKPINTSSNSSQKFFCKIKNCGKSFESLDQLKLHLDFVHR